MKKTAPTPQKIFIGQYTSAIDSQNRVTLPPKWKSALVGNLYIQKGFDGCLEVRTQEEFDIFISAFINAKHNVKGQRILKRVLLAGSQTTIANSWGKILIPGDLIKQANMGKKVCFCGVGTFIEIWDEEIYNSWLDGNSDKVESLMVDESKPQ